MFVWGIEESNFSIEEPWVDDIPQVSDEENTLLVLLILKLRRGVFRWNTIKRQVRMVF
jgi:hypothetical protein